MECEELYQRALETRNIKNTFLAKELLQYLWDNRHRKVPTLELAEAVFEDERPEKAERRVRERIYDLKARLEDFELRLEAEIRFEIPDAGSGRDSGYQLICLRRPSLSFLKVFWGAHIECSNVPLYYGEPVFFFNPKDVSYLRFYEVNSRGQKNEQLIEDLDAKHGVMLKRLFSQDLKSSLSPRHVYIGMGEMEAMDVLVEQFRQWHINPKRKGSERTASILDEGGCPVLTGNARSNHPIEYLFNTKDGKSLGFRPDDKAYGFIKIKNIRERERSALQGFNIKRVSDDETLVGSPPALSTEEERFTLVHRLRVPGGEGVASIISSDYTFGLRQVAVALDQDVKQIGTIMQKTGWRENKMPESFEMIFKVKSAAMHEHDADKAELLAWRPR